MSRGSWRVALRIAHREARRARGRSILVMAMVGLPVLALTFAAVAIRTGELPREEVARRELGAADLRAVHVSTAPVRQDNAYGWSSQEGGPVAAGTVESEQAFARRLPAGSRTLQLRTEYGLRLQADDAGVTLAEYRQLTLGDPMTEGLLRLRGGREPRSADEVAVTPELRSRLGVGLGDTIEVVDPRRSLTVVGIVVVPQEVGAITLVSRPEADLRGARTGFPEGNGVAWLVDLPAGADDLDVMRELNRAGYFVLPRSWLLDPPAIGDDAVVDTAAVGVVVVAAGLAALEVVLLAGTAFAVGARRRRRELGVLAATGATRADVVRVVLAGGVVLGAVAGVVGAIGGVLLVFALRGQLDRLNGAMLGPLDLRPLELVGIVLLGLGTAVLAAVVPARAASRTVVVEALTGRRGQVRTPRRVPVAGVAAIAVGSLVAFWAAGSGPTQAASESLGGGSPDPGRPARFTLLLVGAVVAELGFVTCAPALVGLVGRIARRLPLPLRLAVRDAARHRTRSGPAVAAVVAAVAGSVAVSVYLASDVDRQRRRYQPLLPSGVVSVDELDINGDSLSDGRRAAAIRELPVADEIAIADPSRCVGRLPCEYWSVRPPATPACPVGVDPKANPTCRPPMLGHGAVVGGTDLVEVVLGRADERVRQAMAAGAVVVFDDRLVEGGRTVLVRERYVDRSGRPMDEPEVTLIPVPAVALDAPSFNHRPSVVIPPATAQKHGLPVARTATWLTTERMPTDREVARARSAADSGTVQVYVERGFQSSSGLALLLLTAASTAVTIGATGIATGLAAADSRPDLATLAAVGAAPRVRRVLAMSQAATVAGLGSVLGVLAGLVPSVAVIVARAEFELHPPWLALAATTVGVPVLAALLVGALSRSRLPLERRLA